MLDQPGFSLPSSFRLRHADGSWRWMEGTATNLLAEPSVRAVVINYRDVTERKQAEVALRESEARYRMLINTARDLIFTLDLDGKITSLNPWFETFIGWSRADWLGRSFDELIASDDRSRALDQVNGLLHGATLHAIRLRVPTRAGETLVVDLNMSPQFKEGHTVGLLGIARDITEKQRAEDALKASEKRFRALIENSSDAVALLGADGTTLYASPATHRVLGYTPDERVGRNIFELLHPDDVPSVTKLFAELLQSPGALVTAQVRYRHKAWGWRWYEGTGHNMLAEPSVQAIVTNYRDITERKQAEEALRQRESILEAAAYNAELLLKAPDWRTEINTVLERLGKTINASHAYLFENHKGPDGETVTSIRFEWDAPFCSSDVDNPIFQNVPLSAIGFESWYDAMRRKQPYIGDKRIFNPVEMDFYSSRGIKALLEMPIYINDQWWGIIGFDDTVQEREWSKAEADSMIIAANILGAAIQRKQAEEILRESEERYRLIASISSDYVFSTRLDADGKLAMIWIAGAFEKITGYTPEEFITRGGWRAALHPDDLEVDDRDLEKLFANQPVITEVRVIMKGGKMRWVRVYAYPVWDAERNELVGIHGAVQDISERQQAEEEIRRRADEMTTLYETTHDLVIERDLSKLLHIIVARAAGLLRVSSGGLYLCEAEQRQVRCVVSYNTPHDYTGTVLKYGEGAAGIVAETGEPLIIDDYRTWAGRATVYEQDQPFVSVLSVPMRWQDRVTGVIHILESAERRAFTEQDLRIATLFANQAAIAVQNARLFEAEQQHREEAAAIADVGRDISVTLQLDVVLEKIAAHAINLLRAETSAVYLAEPATSTLRAVVAIGPDAEEIRNDALEIGEGVLGSIAMQGSGEIANDTAAHPRAVTVKGTEITPLEHLMGVPVLSKDHLVGLIAVWRTGAGQEFKPTELDFLSSLAGQVAVAIENARLYAETQQRLREMQGLAQVGEAISQNIELEPLLTQILNVSCETILAANKGSILLLEDHDALRIHALSGYADPRTRTVRFSTDAGYASLAVRKKRGVLVPDALADASITLNVDIPEMTEIQSAMVAPLIVNQRVIGAISLDNASKKSAFTEDDLRLLVAMAAPAALAIENARLFKETRRRLTNLEILQTISTALRVAKTLDEALPIILDQLINLLDVGSALLDILDPSSGEIVTELAYGVWAPMTGMRTPRDVGGSGHVISTGQPYISNDLIADGLVAHPDMLEGLNVGVCVPIVAQHQPIGALWIGHKTTITEEVVTLLTALGEMVGNTIHRMSLHEQSERLLEDLRGSNMELTQAYDTTLEGWAKALELRDKETEGHSRRVTELTLQLAGYMGIPESELTHIRRGVLLHDIGKMGIPDQVLKKTGSLTEDEWGEMRKHPQYAYDLLFRIEYLRPALDIPYCHHEHWDGSGYPRGLKGDQTPMAARIFAIVDVWDALMNDRPYRKAWPREKTLSYIREQSGTYFDPVVAEKFLEMIAPEANSET